MVKAVVFDARSIWAVLRGRRGGGGRGLLVIPEEVEELRTVSRGSSMLQGDMLRWQDPSLPGHRHGMQVDRDGSHLIAVLHTTKRRKRLN